MRDTSIRPVSSIEEVPEEQQCLRYIHTHIHTAYQAKCFNAEELANRYRRLYGDSDARIILTELSRQLVRYAADLLQVVMDPKDFPRTP